MKIVFLNIWNCAKRESVEEFIRLHAQDTDVFCLQEAYEKTKWLCKDLFQDYRLFAAYKYLADNDDFPLATYVRNTQTIVATHTLMSATPATGLVLHTHLRTAGKDVHIGNIHGTSKPGDKLDNAGRLLQSQELLEAFNTEAGLKIIGGDFNLDPATKSIKLFEEAGYRNLISDYKIPTTRNRFVWERYPETKQYFSDYVFVTANVKVTNFLVPNLEVSDHLPMIVTLDL